MSTSRQALLSGSRSRGTASIKLPDLPRAVARLTGGPTRGYRTFYSLVLDGKLPAERDEESGRTWRVRPEHVPEIVRLVGLQILELAESADGLGVASPTGSADPADQATARPAA